MDGTSETQSLYPDCGLDHAPSPHHRKFQKFILETFEQGDTRLTPAEIEQAVIQCLGRRPIHLDEWIQEYRSGDRGLGLPRSPSG